MGALPPGLSTRRAARAAAAAALAAVVAACTDATAVPDDGRPGPAASLERLAPDSFTVAPGDTTPLAVGVRVLDARGRPVPGVEVRWEPFFYVAPARSNTDVNGEARATWRPPPLAVAGRPEPLRAVVGAGDAERQVAFVALVREKVIYFGTVIRADTLPRNTGVVLEVGQSARYITYGRGPNDAVVSGVPARWSSRDTARATVDRRASSPRARRGRRASTRRSPSPTRPRGRRCSSSIHCGRAR
jgi:hypothetical protein